MALTTLIPEYFQHLNTCPFSKRNYFQIICFAYTAIFKTISCVCSKNNGESHVEKSFLAIAGLLVRFLTLPSGSGLRLV